VRNTPSLVVTLQSVRWFPSCTCREYIKHVEPAFYFTNLLKAVRILVMKNIILFQKLGQVRNYQLKCAVLLTAVPLFCASVLTGLLFFLAQLNLYYLENGGLIINEEIRQAYHYQVQMSLWDVAWYMGLVFLLTFGLSYLLMGWAVSPFVNAEKVLRGVLRNSKTNLQETDWLSESPIFHRSIWTLAKRALDKSYPYEKMLEPHYQFVYPFFFKFVLTFFAVSMAMSYVAGIILSTTYMKVVDMAITLVRMNQKGYYFLAQEQVLQIGVTIMLVLSCLVYVVMGYYITRYMSNMLFVFSRALKECHFPLKLRDSDIYHGLADAVSEVAKTAGLARR
jgi:hypothetical protein